MKPIFDLEQQRTMAAERYPAEWARAHMLNGKRRSNALRAVRDKAVLGAQMDALPFGVRCGNCKHLKSSPGHGIGQYCDWHTDSDGYAVVRSDHVCPDWQGGWE